MCSFRMLLFFFGYFLSFGPIEAIVVVVVFIFEAHTTKCMHKLVLHAIFHILVLHYNSKACMAMRFNGLSFSDFK